MVSPKASPATPPTPASRFIAGPARAVRAYEELAAAIRHRIVSGELGVGDRLPPEAALAREAQVSRSTVREALRTLEQAGFVERSSPKIMVVRAQQPDPIPLDLHAVLHGRKITFEHLHETLSLLEPELARLAAERARDEQFMRLEENLAAQAQVVDDFPAWVQLDQEFHSAIAEMSENPALVVVRTLASQMLAPVVEPLLTSSGLIRRALGVHQRLLEAIRIRDSVTAVALARQDLSEFRTAWDLVHAVDSTIDLWATFEL
jgi:DNA-binding FadR family transcriptional regulator